MSDGIYDASHLFGPEKGPPKRRNIFERIKNPDNYLGTRRGGGAPNVGIGVPKPRRKPK